MGGKGIRFFVYAITICILYVVLNYLNNRDTVDKSSEQDKIHYVVKIPGALKYIYLSLFLLGMIMFLVFVFFKLKGNPTVTDGHIRLSLVVAGIGLFVMVLATKWKVNVNGSQLEICRLFHKNKIIQISEIDKIERGKKDQLILFKGEKKMVAVDVLSDNYDLFRETLKQYGKIK